MASDPSFLALIEAVLSLATPSPPRPKQSSIKAGGHPEEIFLDLSEEEKHEYECSICYQILREAMQCSNKHKYCHSCIYVWSTSGQYLNRTRCPVCRQQGYYSRNPDLDEKIENKKVKCTLKGCKWIGPLKQMVAHRHTNYTYGQNTSENQREKDSKDGELPRLGRSTPRGQMPSRTGLQFPSRLLHLRVSFPSDRNIAGNSLTSDNNNNTTTENHAVQGGSPRTPRPPSTPRPVGHMTRRTPTLPSLINPAGRLRPIQRRSALPVSPILPSASQSVPQEEDEPVSTQVNNNLTRIRDRLQESRSRLDSLMTTFRGELEDSRQEVASIQAERERHRQNQLDEVRDLGRRLGQVASELRRLLDQRRSIRDELDDLTE